MRTVVVQPLNITGSLEFGSYRNILAPASEKLRASLIEFFRDALPQTLGQATIVSYSTCRVEPQEMVIDATECHSRTVEMLMPMDADVLMHFAPATPPADGVPLDKIRVFRIPRGRWWWSSLARGTTRRSSSMAAAPTCWSRCLSVPTRTVAPSKRSRATTGPGSRPENPTTSNPPTKATP